MAENEELKSLLMKVKEESEKVGLKFRWEGPLGTPRGLVHWKRASSPVEAGTSGFL